MIKAFIFDIDGTLIDSNEYHAKAWAKAFAAHGKNVSIEEIRPHLGKGGDQLLPEFLTAPEMEKEGDAIARKRGEVFKHEYLSQIRPFAKVRELFKKIRDAGASIALASSSKPDEVAEFRIVAQIDDLVEKSTSSEDAEKSKPHPDIFESALKQLGLPAPDTVLVVGDTPYDAIAAVKAKLPVIGVLCGGFSKKSLRAAGCQAVYRDPAQIYENLDQILHQQF